MISPVVAEIKRVLEAARGRVARQINGELLSAYWSIGRIIVEYEQSQPGRADYGKQTLRELSRALTKELGQGLFHIKPAIHAAFLPLLSNSTDSVC